MCDDTSDDVFEVGPVQLSDIRLSASAVEAKARWKMKPWGWKELLRLSLPKWTLERVDLRGSLLASSKVCVPKVGLAGQGRITVKLTNLTLRDNQVRAQVYQTLEVQSGLLRLQATATANGSTRIDDRIKWSEWKQHLSRSANWTSADFTFDARLGLGPIQLLETAGSGWASASQRRWGVAGQYHGGLPPMLYSGGQFQFDLVRGLRLRGGSVGLLIPAVNDLGPGFKGLGDISGFRAPAPPRLLPEPSLSYSHDVFEPGLLQFGVSLFDVNVSSGNAAILSVGVSPMSSILPYWPNGARMPFAGKATGLYVGGSLIVSGWNLP